MPRILIERLAEDAQPPQNIAGRRVTIDVRDLPLSVTTLDAAIEYVIQHPDVLPLTLLRLVELYRGKPINPKPQ